MTIERTECLAVDTKVVLDEIIMAKRLGNTTTLTFHLSKLSPLTTGFKEFLAALSADDEVAIVTHRETIIGGANELFEARQIGETTDDMVFVGEGKDKLISAISRATDTRTYVCQVDGPYRKMIDAEVPIDASGEQVRRAIIDASGDPEATVVSETIWRKRGDATRELVECDDVVSSYGVSAADEVWQDSIFDTLDEAKTYAQGLVERGLSCEIKLERTLCTTRRVRSPFDTVSALVEMSGPMLLAASWS